MYIELNYVIVINCLTKDQVYYQEISLPESRDQLMYRNFFSKNQRMHIFFFQWLDSPLGAYAALFFDASRSHSDTPHSVGLLWTSDQPVAETST
jgi:hypothetical protein